MKERTQSRRKTVIPFRMNSIMNTRQILWLPQQSWTIKARKEPVKMDIGLSLPWKQKAPRDKYEIPYKFSKTQQLRSVKTLNWTESSLLGSLNAK